MPLKKMPPAKLTVAPSNLAALKFTMPRMNDEPPKVIMPAENIALSNSTVVPLNGHAKLTAAPLNRYGACQTE
jgi:hypothetical protein